MSDPQIRTVAVNGHEARVLEKGNGPKLGYLAGLAGAPRWTPFLEALSREHHVICPSLPGFPGATGHEELDSLVDWLAAVLDLLDASGLSGQDIAANSVGALLALEIAALSPASVKRLALMSPLGLYDEAMPVPHIWARRSADIAGLLSARPDELARLQAAPDGADVVEWNLVLARAVAAGARLLWPMCDLGTAKRLHRVRQQTLLIWGSEDRIVAPAYMKLFAEKLSGSATTMLIPGAGHLVDIDAPEEAASAIGRFLRG
jgi:pimeloyl-ACP methyl ester carboxylesterase